MIMFTEHDPNYPPGWGPGCLAAHPAMGQATRPFLKLKPA
jgi:hypothetical protein